MALTESPALHAHSSTGNTTATQLDPHDTVTAQHDNTSLVAVSEALRDSPLGRLPPEIRNTIYTMTLAQPHGIIYWKSAWVPLEDGAPLTQALNIRATCKQIRDETESMFFDLNEIRLYSTCDYQNPPGSWPHLQKSVDQLNAIPLTFVPASSKVIVWLYSTTLQRSNITQVSRVAQGIHHFQVFVGVFLSVHPWGGDHSDWGIDESASDGGQAHQGTAMTKRPLCPRSADSMVDCARFELIFPIRDRMTALNMVEDAYRSKISLVEAHQSHRFCPIRCELEKLLQSSIQVRQKLIDLVQQACA